MFITEGERIAFLLERNARCRLEDFLYMELRQFLDGAERKLMLTGEGYYRGEHDVLKRRREYIDEHGHAVAEPNLANNRIPHGFLRALVDQKTGYLLSKPFSYQTSEDAYADALRALFNEDFRRTLKDLGEEAVIKGVAWLQVYYDEDGRFSAVRIPAEQVLPFWSDTAHTRLDAVLRVYDIVSYEGMNRRVLTKAEFWDTEGVRFYELVGGALRPDTERPMPEGHVRLSAEGGIAAYNWTRVPFVCFKYNRHELPLIKFVKPLIDDYDLRKSDSSNTLEDLPNFIYVLKNYDGTHLGEFRRNMALYRAVKVSGDGGVDTVSAPVASDALARHLEMTRRDIYAFGRGIDPLDEHTGAASGVALKFLYAHLDTDCNIMESEFQAGLRQLLWFYATHLNNAGMGDFTDTRVDIAFNRDIIINETDAIDGVKNSAGLLSTETLLSMHPAVSDVKAELERLAEEAARDTAADYGALGADDEER